MGLTNNAPISSMDEAPTVVMSRKPLPLSAATDEHTLVDCVAPETIKDERTLTAPLPKPAQHAASAGVSKVPTAPAWKNPIAPAPKAKPPAQLPPPPSAVPRPRAASTPPPLPPSVAKPSRAPVPPLPAQAKTPVPSKRTAPLRPHV